MAAPKKTTALKAPAAPIKEVIALPRSIVLKNAYGFYNEDGTLLFWNAGFTITNEEHIAILIERGIELE